MAILVRNVTNKIQEFSAGLQKKTSELEQERKRTENLLFQLLPQTVAKKLMVCGHVLPEAYHSVTVMFSDVVGFTAICSRSSPMEVVAMLNKLYQCFDEKLENYDIYKLETIGEFCVPYCKSGKIRENFIFANSVKRHIYGVKGSWLGRILHVPISVNDRVISSFREDLFSRNFAYAKFCENKTLAKISEFTVWKSNKNSSMYGIRLLRTF